MTGPTRDEMVDLLAERGISDEAVLAAMRTVPRERFVPERLRDRAYDDAPLPIGHDATISQPWVVARMLELAGIGEDDRVLDVGTGSGYAAAVADELAAEVVSLERVRPLATAAAEALAATGHEDVEVVVADGTEGWPDRAPYDAILVAAATPSVPSALTDQLAVGGRLVLPLGDRGVGQRLTRIVRGPDGLSREEDRGVRFVPLLRGTEED